MPKYMITAPDGQTFEVDAPEGATEQDALEYVRRQQTEQTPNPVETKAPPERSMLEEIGSYADGLVRSIAKGVTFDSADEIAAYLSTLTGIGEQGQPGQGYDQNLAAERARDKQFADENPVSSTVGEIGGAVAGTIAPVGWATRTLGAGAKAGPLASKLMTPAKSMVGKMGQASLAGATGGGIYGFNAGEGGFENRMKGAGAGAATGAAVGMLAPPIIAAGSKAAQSLLDAVIRRGPRQVTAAQRKVAENIMRDFPDMSADDALSAAEARLKQLGPEAALMDVGPNSRGVARSAYTIPGEGKTIIDDFLTARQEGIRGANNVLKGGQANRITSALDDVTPDRLRGTMDDLNVRRQASAGPLYDEAFAKKGIHTDRLNQFMDDPTAKAGLKAGVEIQRLEALAQGKPFNPMDAAITGFNEAGDPIIGGVPNMRTYDAIKRGLDAMIDAETDVAGKVSQRGRALIQVKNAFTSELDSLNPAYAEARAAYSGPSQLMDAAKAGSEFMRGGIGKGGDDLAAQIAKMSDDERHYFRIGAVQAMRDRIEGLVTRADASKKVMDIPGLENKIRTVFGDDDMFRRYIDMLKNERTMFESYGAIKGGSRTGEVLAEQVDQGIDRGRIAGGITDLVTPGGGIIDRARGAADILGGIKDRATIPRDMSKSLAEMLTGRDVQMLRQQIQAQQLSEAQRNRLTQMLLRANASGTAQAYQGQ